MLMILMHGKADIILLYCKMYMDLKFHNASTFHALAVCVAITKCHPIWNISLFEAIILYRLNEQ